MVNAVIAAGRWPANGNKMEKNMKLIFPSAILLILLSGLLIFWFTAILRLPLKKREIDISGKRMTVWVADTHESRLAGLQNIIWMPQKTGMLFVFDRADRYCFWNKNTLIPLRLIFMREGNVTEEFKLQPIWKGKQSICPLYELIARLR
jgi:uncharacterized membrane protein (UPF0127 family)